MQLAHDAAKLVLPRYASKYSRKDFTLPQLFACLVVKTMFNVSYADAESILRDTDWCGRLGMPRVPDHSTLNRAFNLIVIEECFVSLSHVLIDAMNELGHLGDTLAIDSTMYDTHHSSRHYEHRCRRNASIDKEVVKQRKSEKVKAMPKLAIGVDTRTHLIVSALAKTGAGGDASDFGPLLLAAFTHFYLYVVLADAGYDSQHNHQLARDQLCVESWIKASTGRPSHKPAADRHRRLMQQTLQGSQAGKPYGQRAQVETVMSMLKRNLGAHLRARTARGREMELLLKAMTHNLMIVWRKIQRAATEPDGPRCLDGVMARAVVQP